MKPLSKIASYFFVGLTLMTFIVSTIGFTFYTHECQHHDSQKGLVSTDECCEVLVDDNQAESNSCCSPKPVKAAETKCNSEYQGSKCCETDMNYFRLSELFVGPQVESMVEYFAVAELNYNRLELDNELEQESINLSGNPPDKVIKVPLYRLYHQAKTDPPLI